MNQIVIKSALFLLLSSSVVVAKAPLKIEPEIFEFGMVAQDSRIAKYFWFEAIGPDSVFIDSIKTGCVCVLMPLEKEVLAPGEKMRVGLFWDIGKRMGAIGQHPYIFFNGREMPYLVGLKGHSLMYMDSIEPVTVQPYKVELPRLPAGTKSVDEVELGFHNLTDERLEVKVVASSVESQVELKLPESIKAGGKATGKVIIRPEYTDESFEGSFTLEFSDETRTRLTIPVRRKIY